MQHTEFWNSRKSIRYKVVFDIPESHNDNLMYVYSAQTNLPSNAQSLFCQIQREIFIMATISKIHQKIDIVLLLQCVVVLNWHYKDILMKLNIVNILWHNFTIWLIY